MSSAGDPQLNLLLRQLGRMYESLRAMQRGIGQRDPQLFKIMAEGPLDEIRQLQHSIDQYTGVAELRDENVDVWVRIDGPDIDLESAPTSVVTSILDAFRKGVQSIAEVMTTGELSTRPTRELKEAADMRVVALAPGSLQIGLRLTEPSQATLPDSPPRGTDVVESALRTLMSAAEGLSSDEERPAEGDDALQLTVWNALKSIVPRERGGVDLVELRGRSFRNDEPVRLTRIAHERINRHVELLVKEELQTHRGIVREIDLDKRTFKLRSRTRRAITCAFNESLAAIAKEALDHHVEVSGTRKRRGGRQSGPVDVVSLEIIEDRTFSEVP